MNSVIPAAVSLCALAAMALSLPFRKKNLARKLGTCALKLPEPQSSVLPIIVLACTPLLPILQCFRTFETYIHIVICCIPVLAAYVMMQELLLRGKAGIYADAVIAGGRFLKKSDIYAFAETDSPQNGADSGGSAACIVRIITQKGETVDICCASPADRETACRLLRAFSK